MLGTDLSGLILKNKNFALSEKIPFCFGLGFALVGFAVFGLGKLNILYPGVLIGFSLTYLFIKFLANIKKTTDFLAFINKIDIKKKIGQIKKFSIVEKLFIGTIIVAFALDLSVAIAPEIGFDSLWYHLEMGKTYLAEHSIVFFSGESMLSPASVMPRLTDLIYTYAMSFKISDLTPKLIHFMFLILTTILSYKFIIKTAKNRSTALFSVLFLLLIQPIQNLSGTAYIDLATLFYATATFYLFYFYFEKSEESLFVISAIFCGICLSIKLWNFALLPIYMIAVLIKTKKISKMLKFFAISILFVSPFLIEAYVLTGNPIFPVLSISDADHLSGAKDINDWIFNVHPSNFWQYIYKDYLTNGMLLCFIPLVFLFKNIIKKYRFLIIFSIAYLFAWSYIPVHEFRYGLAGLFPMVILSSFVFDEISKRNCLLKGLTVIIVLIYCAFNLTSFAKANENRLPAPLTQKARKAYLSAEIGNNKFTYYDASGEVKKIIGNKKALIMAHNMFYVDFKYFDLTRLMKDFEKITEPDKLIDFLSNGGYEFIVFRGDADIKHFFEMLPPFAEDPRWQKNHFNLVKQLPLGSTKIYEIKTK
jgi:hypothetical protein